MTLLPVVERELRVAARLPGTYWVRLIAALVGLGIGGWIMLIPDVRNTPATLGIALFVAMSIIVNLYGFLAFLRTADSLAEEKREGTLGLLFLTDLKGFDIVLGKLAATSLHTFYGMLAIFPIMAISLLVGGVSGAEFWRVVLASMNTLFFSLGLGIFCSAISVDERKSVALSLCLALFFVVGLPILGGIVKGFETPWPEPFFFVPSPGYSVFIAFDAPYHSLSQYNYFKLSLIVQFSLTLLFLLLSCFIVPRTWHDKVRDAGERRQSFWQNLRFGTTARREARRLNGLAINPFHWLTNRERMKHWMLWLFLATVALIWLFGLLAYDDSRDKTMAYVWTGVIVHTVIKLWLAGEAGRRFCLDRQSGALELLLSTPLSVPEILRGQFISLRRQFALPVALVLCADLFFLASEGEADWTFMWIALISMFVADLITLAWVGMWLALNSRSVIRAALATIVRVLFLPWFVFFALLTAAALYGTFFSRYVSHGKEVKSFIALWMLFGFINNLIFGLWAARNLHKNFRLAATRRFETRRHANAPTPPMTAAPVPQLLK